LQHALEGIPDFPAQLALRGFETAHRAALLLQVGQRLQTVFGLELIQVGVGLAELGVHGGPSRVGNFAGGIVGHGGVFDQRIPRRILPLSILKRNFLAASDQTSDTPLERRGKSRREVRMGVLMAIVHKAGDLAQSQFAL